MAPVRLDAVELVSREALADQIVGQISSWVLTGRLAPGDLLPPEQELAAHFGVSRTAVREAARVLVAKGFVRVRQGVGTTVNAPDQWNWVDPHIVLHTRRDATYEDLAQARRLIEPGIAALAARHRDETCLATLSEALEQGSQVRTVADHVRWDMAFHHALTAATGNPMLEVMVNSLAQILRASRAALCRVPGSVERANAHHRRIYEAVAAADADAAQTAMSEHLQQVRDDFALLQETQQDPQ